MDILNGGYGHCPRCGSLVGQATWDCPLCGADIPLVLEECRLAKEYLRYLSLSLLGGMVTAATVVIALGALPRYLPLLTAILVISSAVAGALWLWAGTFDPYCPNFFGTEHEQKESTRNRSGLRQLLRIALSVRHSL